MRLAEGTFTTFPAAMSSRLGLEANEQVVLLWICHYTNQNGHCWPSLRRLCQDTRLSLSTVRRAIAGLVERGALRVQHRVAENGCPTSNLYEVLVSDGTEVVSEGTDPSLQGEQLTKPKKELKDIPQLVSVGQVWTECTGGVLNLNRHGGELLKVINSHSIEAVCNALKSYCAKTQPKWRSIARFIENPCIEKTKEELDFERL